MPVEDPREAALREDAVACLLAGVAAAEPERLVREALALAADPLGGARPVRLVALGKAAGAMARGAIAALGARVAGGVAIVPAGQESSVPAGLEVFGGGHPVPNAAGVAGAAAIRELAERLGEGDGLLALVSGGGSALMTLPPPGVELEALQDTTRLLLEAGATIGELNCVRKHLDRLKGGRLARAAAPARVLGLVLSDVVGDPLDVIASGPLSPDPTSFAEALGVLARRGVAGRVPAAVTAALEAGARGGAEESPKPGDPCFARVEIRIVGNNRLAAEAVAAEAERRGYRAELLTTELTGEARQAGGELAATALGRRAGGPLCLVSAGETTVTVTGGGRGGRNQELALAAALALDGVRGVAIASLGTDGVDGPTDAAGAIATGSTRERARALGLDPVAALAANDAYPFFAALGDLIVTGPTGTNVMDLQVALVAPDAGR